MGHTKEPWRIDDKDGAVVRWNTAEIARASYLGGTNTAKANARRIVSAVNFCADIPTDQLEGVTLGQVLGALRDILNIIDDFETIADILSHFDGARSSTVEPDNPESVVAELSRLVNEYRQGDGGTSAEAWNLIVDCVVSRMDELTALLGSTPAAPTTPNPEGEK